MTLIIINPSLPLWVRCGEKRPPEWLRTYFPNLWEKELIQYGEPGEVGEYFAEQTIERVLKEFHL